MRKSVKFAQKIAVQKETMNTKQKKKLLWATITVILVATIILMALGLSGHLSPSKKSDPKEPDPVPSGMLIDSSLIDH